MPLRRTPQGVRGLKPEEILTLLEPIWSHSARSAWIETFYLQLRRPDAESRTPQGVRGLKPGLCPGPAGHAGRTPQGVRGLKLYFRLRYFHSYHVALRKECVD